MSATSIVPTLQKLTPKQRKFVELVASGEGSDIHCYQQAYGGSEANAHKNACRLRKKPHIRKALISLQTALEETYLQAITNASKKGRLARIMLEGKDSDAIRAIKELNVMELREAAMGGGEETEFTRLLMLVADRRRVLPHEDPRDSVIEV